ncbi:MAG: hypothetical protein M9899_07810 [Bdellovibrionaceae bacterium]|nr:hypothetical protein [Pseudobdellovibrionaceae bacterium]
MFLGTRRTSHTPLGLSPHCWALLLLAVLFISPLAFAEVPQTTSLGRSKSKAQDIIYQADVIQADMDRESAILKGNVVIMFDGYQLFARQAEIFKKENRFIASGDIRIESVQTQIVAEEVEVFFDSKKGSFKKARLVSGQMLFEADEISKMGDDLFEASNATFTTCLTCPPSWRFKASSLKTNVKKFVDIKNGYLQVANQSMLWLPRIILPVNTRRKSGLIQPKPHMSFSRKQPSIEVGYFWAIEDNKDLTFTPKLYFRSGVNVKGIVNYRHMFSPESQLELTTGYMRDPLFLDYNYTTNTQRYRTQHRWFVDYKNKLNLPGGFVQKSNIKLTEDLLYLSDFPTELPGHKESALVNQVSLVRNNNNQHFATEIIYNINLLTEDMNSKNLDAVHKTPTIKYSILNTPFLKNKFSYRLNTEYTKFSRRETSYDEVTLTGTPLPDPPKVINTTAPIGQFDPRKDIIRSGERLILRPELTTSVNLGNLLRFEPDLKYHQAVYNFAPYTTIVDPNAPYTHVAQMGYLEGELRLKSQLSKVLSENWKHLLEPQVRFIRGEILTQTDHVFFKSTRGMPYHRRFQPITEADFFEFEHGIQFDYQDRIYDTSVIEFSLLQSFLRKNKDSGVTYYDQPIYLDISQSYDFLHANAPNPDPWSNLNALLKIKSKHFETFTMASHFHKLSKTNISTRNKFIYKPGHFIEGLYKNAYIVDRNNNETSHQELVGAGLGWEFTHLHLSGNFLYSTFEKQMQGWALRTTILPPGDCWEIYINIYDNNNQRSANRPEVDLNVSWNFGDGYQTKHPQNNHYVF